jgi:hypothetical protein
MHEPLTREPLIESFLATILTQLPHTHANSPGSVADVGRLRVRIAMEYIESRLAHAVRMGDVAQHVGVGLLHRSSLAQRFSARAFENAIVTRA